MINSLRNIEGVTMLFFSFVACVLFVVVSLLFLLELLLAMICYCSFSGTTFMLFVSVRTDKKGSEID